MHDCGLDADSTGRGRRLAELRLWSEFARVEHLSGKIAYDCGRNALVVVFQCCKSFFLVCTEWEESLDCFQTALEGEKWFANLKTTMCRW